MMNEEQFTDALGEAEITGMKPPTMKICFSKEGYEDVTKPFTIKGEAGSGDGEEIGLSLNRGG